MGYTGVSASAYMYSCVAMCIMCMPERAHGCEYAGVQMVMCIRWVYVWMWEICLCVTTDVCVCCVEAHASVCMYGGDTSMCGHVGVCACAYMYKGMRAYSYLYRCVQIQGYVYMAVCTECCVYRVYICMCMSVHVCGVHMDVSLHMRVCAYVCEYRHMCVWLCR